MKLSHFPDFITFLFVYFGEYFKTGDITSVPNSVESAFKNLYSKDATVKCISGPMQKVDHFISKFITKRVLNANLPFLVL